MPLPGSSGTPGSGVRPQGVSVDAQGAARRARKLASFGSDSPTTPGPGTFVAEIVLVEGVPGQSVLAQALALDDYTPLVAKHGLEGLTLCLRRRPLLVVVHSDAARLSGRLLAADLRRRPELANVRIVLIDKSDAPDLPDVVRWRDAPADVTRARHMIDEALGEARARATSVGPDDAREIAVIVADLGRQLHASGSVDAGISALRYAAELAPTVSSHTLALSRVLLASADVKLRGEAAALVERVARQDPHATEAYLLRAAALEQRGEKEKAKQALQRCLLFSPGDVDANAALARLAAGQHLIEFAGPPPKAAPDAVAPKKKGFFARLFAR